MQVQKLRGVIQMRIQRVSGHPLAMKKKSSYSGNTPGSVLSRPVA